MSVKVIKLPPRNLKQALQEIVDEYGDDMEHFMLVGCTKEAKPFCYTSCESIHHLAAAKLIVEIAVHDAVYSDDYDGGAA